MLSLAKAARKVRLPLAVPVRVTVAWPLPSVLELAALKDPPLPLTTVQLICCPETGLPLSVRVAVIRLLPPLVGLAGLAVMFRL